ncbi:MAG: hypothetical protein ACFFBW_16980 [Promethearchaeota archaeon]
MKKYFSFLIGILAILIVFFIPFGIHIDLGPGPNSIVSMVWEIPLSPAWYSIRFFSAFRYYFQYCFFRLLFLVDIFLLILGKFNKIRFLLIAFISEIIPLMISIPAMYILNPQGENLIAIILPIPFLFAFALTLFLLRNRLEFTRISEIP